MKLKWIYWVSTGLPAANYLGGGTLYLSNISGVTCRNKCDWSAARRQSARGHLLVLRRSHAKMKADIGVSEVEKQAAGAGEDA